MRVCVFDASGQLLGRLQLQDSLQFPNAICAGVGRDGSDEIFVSDNRAHCVKVFDYRGTLKRSIGGPGTVPYYMYTIIRYSYLVRANLFALHSAPIHTFEILLVLPSFSKAIRIINLIYSYAYNPVLRMRN